jgi:hypothetical protein
MLTFTCSPEAFMAGCFYRVITGVQLQTHLSVSDRNIAKVCNSFKQWLIYNIFKISALIHIKHTAFALQCAVG